MKTEKARNQTCVLYGTNHGVILEISRNLEILQHQRWKRKGRAPKKFCNSDFGKKLIERENRLIKGPKDVFDFLTLQTNDYDIKQNIKIN